GAGTAERCGLCDIAGRGEQCPTGHGGGNSCSGGRVCLLQPSVQRIFAGGRIDAVRPTRPAAGRIRTCSSTGGGTQNHDRATKCCGNTALYADPPPGIL